LIYSTENRYFRVRGNYEENNFFIVGAPKSGTTALQDYLRRHPETFMPREKEFHHFATDLIGLNDS
jgi:hypothetical protein